MIITYFLCKSPSFKKKDVFYNKMSTLGQTWIL